MRVYTRVCCIYECIAARRDVYVYWYNVGKLIARKSVCYIANYGVYIQVQYTVYTGTRTGKYVY